MTGDRYRLSFTVGALLVREAGVAADLYQQLGDWVLVRAAIDSDNLLQARTVASGRRLGREVVQRLGELTESEVALLVEATATERGHLMWVAACRRYRLVGEFAEEVVRERFLLLADTISPADFDAFVRSKTLWNEELDHLKESTLRKLRANLFLMLHQSGLVSEDGRIVPAVLSERVVVELAGRLRNDLRFFPTAQVATAGNG